MSENLVFRSKNEHIYDLLKRKIVRSELKPDELLVIDVLAKELGVSAIPVREALRRLEANGFVNIEPYVGAKVTALHEGSITEVFSMLRAMEIISGRAACVLMSDADLDYLETIVRDMARLLDDHDAWSDRNKQLHQYICHKAQMTVIEKMLLVALDHWDRLRFYYLEEVFAQRVKFRQAEHEQMLEALRKRDPDLLEQIMHQHNEESLQAYLAYLQQRNTLTSGNHLP
jgi:DNA-binding GntR family transcriptional regulator